MSSLPPLARIPIVFCAAFANSSAFTSPTPPPSTNARMRHAFTWERVFNAVVLHLTTYMKRIGWVIFVGEAAAVLSSRFPSLLPCKYILRFLAHSNLAPSPQIRITPSLLLGTALTATGALIRSYCYRALGRFFTFQLALQRAQGHRLCTSGPYAVVRHPSYTGLIMTIAAFVLWSGGSGSWLRESGWLATPVGRTWLWAQHAANVYAVASLLFRTRVEDEALREEFGDEWVRWAEKVPYKILPGLY